MLFLFLQNSIAFVTCVTHVTNAMLLGYSRCATFEKYSHLCFHIRPQIFGAGCDFWIINQEKYVSVVNWNPALLKCYLRCHQNFIHKVPTANQWTLAKYKTRLNEWQLLSKTIIQIFGLFNEFKFDLAKNNRFNELFTCNWISVFHKYPQSKVLIPFFNLIYGKVTKIRSNAPYKDYIQSVTEVYHPIRFCKTCKNLITKVNLMTSRKLKARNCIINIA